MPKMKEVAAWKPAPNEDYFMCLNGEPLKIPWCSESIVDLGNYALGNCFKTREEAETNRKEVLARLKKIYDEGKPLIGEWRESECQE